MYMPYSIMDIFASISYEIMWLFSYVEIMATQLYNQTILPIQESEFFKSIKEFIVDDATICFVKNGDIIHKSSKENTFWFKDDTIFLLILPNTIKSYVNVYLMILRITPYQASNLSCLSCV